MDHATLISEVASRLNRQDLNSLLPSFVQRAEDIIRARLASSPVRPMLAKATSPLVAGAQSVAVPNDFIDVVNLTSSNGSDTWQMLRLDPSDNATHYACRTLPYSTAYDATKVRHFSIIGSTIELIDATPADITLGLTYWQKLPALADGENWLAANHASVYEYGTLAHAYKHLRDDSAAGLNLDLFQQALDLTIEAYPENQNPGELRSDLPVRQAWSILNG